MTINKVIARPVKNSTCHTVRIGSVVIQNATIAGGHVHFPASVEFDSELPAIGEDLTIEQLREAEGGLPEGTVVANEAGDVFQLERREIGEEIWRKPGSGSEFSSIYFFDYPYRIVSIPGVYS